MNNYTNLYDDSKSYPSLKKLKSLIKTKKNQLIITAMAFFLIFTIINKSFYNAHSKNLRIIERKKNLETSNNLKLFNNDLYIRQNNIPIASSTLREKLTFHFPYEPSKPIPNQIWQTWKTDLQDPSFPSNFKNFQQTWTDKNPQFTHFIIPDSIIETFIEDLYGNVPEVVEAYRLLPKNILKADFFRYLVVYARGGTYSDIDTICLKPIQKWANFDQDKVIPYYLLNKNKKNTGGEQDKLPTIDSNTLMTPIGLTIGIEADPDRPDWHEWYARRIQFCQWTIQGKKGHPFLRELIIRIVEQTLRKKEMGVLNRVEGKDQGGDVMQWTGPGIFTDTLFDYLNNVMTNGELGDGVGVGSKYWVDNKKYKLSKVEVNSDNEPMFSDEQVINWKTMSGLKDSLIVDDIMILPITSFSPGVGQMGAGEIDHKLAFVRHMFEGSWKDDGKTSKLKINKGHKRRG